MPVVARYARIRSSGRWKDLPSQVRMSVQPIGAGGKMLDLARGSIHTLRMTTATLPQSRPARPMMTRLVRTGLLTGVVDGSWAIVLTLIYGRSLARLWQGIAATLFGERMFDGGAATVALGVAMHFGVAFAWSALFLLLVARSPYVRRVLDSRYGPLKIGAVYGPFIWIVMSAIVVPLLTGKPLVVTWRWWIQLLGHMVFVGLPIAWGARRWSAPRRPLAS
jgi:hypothetical protein